MGPEGGDDERERSNSGRGDGVSAAWLGAWQACACAEYDAVHACRQAGMAACGLAVVGSDKKQAPGRAREE